MNLASIVNPLNNIFLSALAAILPIGFIFWALIVKKMKSHYASLLAVFFALLISVFVYRMPVNTALLSTLQGALYGMFPICWIIIAIIFFFNIIVKSGQFEVIKHSVASVTSDRRLQALLIAFSFGAFLEGTAGFGAPVAITAALLVGLGFNPFYAAGICLIANTAPVAFGAVGIPIIVASQVTGIPEMAISQMVGRTLPVLSLILPLYLVILISGFKKAIEVLPAISVAGISFAFLQWFSANYLGPALPDIISGGGSIVCLMVFFKFWKPKKIWRFSNEEESILESGTRYTTAQRVKAWFPFILLTIMIIAWGLQPIKGALDDWGKLQFEIPESLAVIDNNGIPVKRLFVFNYLSATGTGIFLTALVSMFLTGIKFSEGCKLFFFTIKQLKFPIITVTAILGFAYIINDSGIAITIANALANTGFLYPFFASVLGWLGVFITGSDTSSNALFGKLQYVTAESIGVDPLVTVAANSSGGVVGKMISPQSIAVATASVNLVGREPDLFRFTLKHSLIMLLLICILTFAQAYFMKWIIPVY